MDARARLRGLRNGRVFAGLSCGLDYDRAAVRFTGSQPSDASSCSGADMRRRPTSPFLCHARYVAFSDRKRLDGLNQTPFVDSAELALILSEPHATVHRTLVDLLAEGIVERISHGTAHLPSSQRYFITANGIRETGGILGFCTPPQTTFGPIPCPGSG